MKFKKVEIQAFRAYNAVNDSTFDFSTPLADQADFISIYAPNGFGKTSFYDAVEWGYTNNIHRFLRKQKFNIQVTRTEKNLSQSTQLDVLRNRYSPKDMLAFVKLHTTDPHEPIIKTDLKKARKGQADYKFDEKETVRSYFQKVILSQEWIDAFLKEENGSDRYQTFVDYFGDKDIDLYYRSLVCLIKENEENIKSLQKAIAGLQLNLQFDGDLEILRTANEVIQELNDNGEKLDLITHDFSDQESVVLGNLITRNSAAQQFEIGRVEKELAILEELVSGSDRTISVQTYFSDLAELGKLEAERKKFHALRDVFELIEKKETQVRALNIEKDTAANLRALYEVLVAKLPAYQQITGILAEIDRLKVSAGENIALQNTLLQEQKKKNTDQVNQQTQNIAQLAKLEQEKVNLPAGLQAIQQLNERLLEYNRQQGESGSRSTELTELLRIARLNENGIRQLIRSLEKGDFTLPASDLFAQFQTVMSDLSKLGEDVLQYTRQLDRVNEEIQKQSSFNKDLKDLIDSGLRIINNGQLDACPLCSHQYNSYRDLSDKVTGNHLFDEILKKLYQDRTELENGRYKAVLDSKKLQDSLSGDVNAMLTEASEKTNVLEKELQLLRVGGRQRRDAMSELEKQLAEAMNILRGRTFEEQQAYLDEAIQAVKLRIEEFEKERPALEEGLKNIERKLSSFQNELKMLQEQDKKLLEQEEYQSLNNFFSGNSPVDASVSPDDYLRALLSNAIARITALQDEIRMLEARIADDRNLVKGYEKDGVAKSISKFSATAHELQRGISRFGDLLNSLFNRSMRDLAQLEQGMALINELRETRNKLIARSQKLIESYTILQKLKDGLAPFLKFEKAKLDESGMKERLKFLKGALKKELEAERQKVALHIDLQINSFFYEDVINDLYRKIDPHPDYKKIKFKCDFTEDKPQLNVCVIDSDREVLQIPNLYFSTAQLNILSLSIFLAKALHATNANGNALDCIFIDDPIQSMDSINILSTIDLFRSIVVNHGKQIILSTHDANFHNLLMKKMPPGPFNSKFMELETFGKVKA